MSFCVAGDAEKHQNDEIGIPECSNLYLSVRYEHVVSTLDFDSAATIAGTITYRSTSEVELASGCSLALLGSDVSPEVCASLTDELRGSGWDQDMTCSGTSVCFCRGGVSHSPSPVTYNANTGQLTGSGSPISYCVKGDTLQLLDRSEGVDVHITYRRQ